MDAQTRIDELDGLIEPKLSDWWGRYQLLQQTLRSASDTEASAEVSKQNSLVPGSGNNIQVGLQETSHTHLLKELCSSADLLRMDTHSAAPILELRSIINVLMSKAGVVPFLLGFPDEVGRRLTMLVAEALDQLFRAHYRCSSLDAQRRIEELAGETSALEDPILAASLMQLSNKFKMLRDRIGVSGFELLDHVGDTLLPSPKEQDNA